MLTLIKELWPLHRTLASGGMYHALERLGQGFPGHYEIEEYEAGARVWTWRVPGKYDVLEARLVDEEGRVWADFQACALRLVSYSLPVDGWFTWQELQPRLYVGKPEGGIPWVFHYYNREWGFCVTHDEYSEMPRIGRYHVIIRTIEEGGLRVGVGVVGDARSVEDKEFWVLAHVDHPEQANDGLAGAVVGLEIARRLAREKLDYRVRFLFVPETIGTVCYLSQHEALIDKCVGGIFLEMPGNDNWLHLQYTRQGDHWLDRMAQAVLADKPHREGKFREVIVNDEYVVNGPGVNIPCLSLSRWPYPEYHSSLDTPEILSQERLEEYADVATEIVRVAACNYRPRLRERGPVFLSGYGLWDAERHLLLDRLMLEMDGGKNLWEIAEEIGSDFWTAHEMVEKFWTRGLVDKL